MGFCEIEVGDEGGGGALDTEGLFGVFWRCGAFWDFLALWALWALWIIWALLVLVVFVVFAKSEVVGDEAGEAEGGIFWGALLVIGGLVSFVDNDEAEVVNRGEKGGTGADDNLGGCREEEVGPDFAAFFRGEVGVEEGDFLIKGIVFSGGAVLAGGIVSSGGAVLAEGVGEDLDELGGEGDFGDEKDGGLAVF